MNSEVASRIFWAGCILVVYLSLLLIVYISIALESIIWLFKDVRNAIHRSKRIRATRARRSIST